MPAPSVPPAPPRLSMISCLPVRRENWADRGRAKASVPPPAGNGTTIVTGLVGQLDWAWADQAPVARAEAASLSTPRRSNRAWVGVMDVSSGCDGVGSLVASKMQALH